MRSAGHVLGEVHDTVFSDARERVACYNIILFAKARVGSKGLIFDEVKHVIALTKPPTIHYRSSAMKERAPS
jgi:hypothetical protein